MRKQDIRQIAKSHGLKITEDGKYKTLKQLKYELTGGDINANQFKRFIDNSYNPQLENVDNYEIDKSLSGRRVKVYKDKNTNEAVVVHKGSQSAKDFIWTDALMPFGYESNRFKHSRNIQDKAEKKYGKENVITSGHSLGSTLAERAGKDTKQVITLNKPTLPENFLNKKNPNQIDVYGKNDIVSFGKNYERKNGKEIILDDKNYNPFTNHSTGIIERGLKKNKMMV